MGLSIARKAIERLYTDSCNVIEYQEIEDPDTHITDMQEVVVYENVPCKLSHKTIQSSGEGVASSLILSSKLILSPDLKIKAGSKIDVTREGVTTCYKNSGEPARYNNHQEIILELFDGWA